MTAEITQVNSCRKNLKGEISAEDFTNELEKVAKEYARNAKIPGFRPGKAPTSIVRQRYAKELQDETSQRMMDKVWQDAIDANNLKPLTRPEIKEFDNKPGEPLKFLLTFEELPPLEVKDYKGVEVKQGKAEVTDENVAQSIDRVREQYSQFVPVEGEAKDGFFVLVDVDGQAEGEEAPTHDEDVTLVVGHPQTAKEFSENLRGAKTGDVKTFDIAYPEDYHNKKLAGKKVAYTVTVKDVKERQLPELNDEFAKDIGFDDAEAFKARMREDLVTQAGQIAEKEARETLLDSIIERQPIEVPDCLVTEELGEYTRRLVNNLAYQGFDINQTAGFDWKKIYDEQRPQAQQSVRRQIFLDAIARQENLEVSEEDVDAELERLAANSRKPAAQWRAELEKADRMDDLKQGLLQDKALDFIYRNANIRVE
ncbi:MAG: trigger factor [Acidobacteriota bacterium]|nr:trigger factor [Acidobacteriota bacterium]